MRVVIQRVNCAKVLVDDKVMGAIGAGVVLLVAVTPGDTQCQADWLAQKIAGLRIFPAIDGSSGFDRSLIDIHGGALVVSQFTLYGEIRNGRRPDFVNAARSEIAAPLIDRFLLMLSSAGVTQVSTGLFGAHMRIVLENDGPVTLILDSPLKGAT